MVSNRTESQPSYDPSSGHDSIPSFAEGPSGDSEFLEESFSVPATLSDTSEPPKNGSGTNPNLSSAITANEVNTRHTRLVLKEHGIP